MDQYTEQNWWDAYITNIVIEKQNQRWKQPKNNSTGKITTLPNSEENVEFEF